MWKWKRNVVTINEEKSISSEGEQQGAQCAPIVRHNVEEMQTFNYNSSSSKSSQLLTSTFNLLSLVTLSPCTVSHIPTGCCGSWTRFQVMMLLTAHIAQWLVTTSETEFKAVREQHLKQQRATVTTYAPDDLQYCARSAGCCSDESFDCFSSVKRTWTTKSSSWWCWLEENIY